MTVLTDLDNKTTRLLYKCFSQGLFLKHILNANIETPAFQVQTPLTDVNPHALNQWIQIT